MPTTTIPATPRGFTLVEMLVVLAIITVVTAIALLSQTDFNRSVLLTDTAYTTALSLREMQSFGFSSRRFNGTAQNAGYGGYFGAPPLSSYTLFADTSSAGTVLSNCAVGDPTKPEGKPGDCLYTAGSDGIVQTYSFTSAFSLNRYCGYDTSSPAQKRCSDDAVSPLTALNIVFLRSSTESTITAKRAGAWIALTSAELYVSSADGAASRAVCVSRVGQISVATDACP